MKKLFQELLVFIYFIISMFILMIAIAYPFALQLNDPSAPLWFCWILYPVSLIIIVTQKRAFKWANKIFINN